MSDYWVASDEDIDFIYSDCDGEEEYETDDCTIGETCPSGGAMRDSEALDWAIGHVFPIETLTITIPSGNMRMSIAKPLQLIKNLHIEGEEGEGNVVIDGGNDDEADEGKPLFIIKNIDNVQIKNLTLQHGYGNSGGTATIESCGFFFI